LAVLETQAGSVWFCPDDGVVDWYFEATAAHRVVAHRAAVR
jgi:hypothetical protein